jgi:hypothetical protein
MTEVEGFKRQVEDLRAQFNRVEYHVKELETLIRQAMGKNMELQGKVSTLAGRIAVILDRK